MSAACDGAQRRVDGAAVEAVREAVRLHDDVQLHETPAVRIAAKERVRLHTDTAAEAIAAVEAARVDIEAVVDGGDDR